MTNQSDIKKLAEQMAGSMNSFLTDLAYKGFYT